MAAPQTVLRSVPRPGDTQQLVASAVAALADIHGITHAVLAERAGIAADKLSKSLKLKRHLTLGETASIAAVFGVPVAVLYDGGDELRRRAKAAVTSAGSVDPTDPGGQENSPTRWYGGTVTELRARRSAPSRRAA